MVALLLLCLGAEPSRLEAAWADLAHVLLCANEFVTLD